MVVTAAYAVDVFSANSAVAGFAASVFLMGGLLSRGFTGKMLGFLGYKTALTIGMAANTLLSFAYILTPNIEFLIIVRLLHGVSFGIITTAAPTIAADVVPASRMGEGMGYFSLGSTVATGIGPFFAMLLSSGGNYPVIFAICTTLMLIGLALCPLMRIKKLTLSAQDAEKLRGFKLSSIIEVPVVPISVVALLLYFCYGGIVSFLALFMRTLDLVEFASLFFVVFAVVVFASRPLVSKLFDARGLKLILIPALACFAVGMFYFSQTQSHWMLLSSSVLIGLGVGATQAVTLAQVAKITPPARQGVASTTYFLFCDIGYFFGPLLIGVCLPSLGFRGVFAILALVTVLNLAYCVFFTGRHSKKRGA
jgi:MFS family permease